MSPSRRRSTLAALRDGGPRMARLAVRMAPALCLAACNYAANPLVGFPHFVGDTHTFRTNPNQPGGTDETTRRAEGQEVTAQPLLPEAGNVWPGPPPPIPSLADIQRLQNLNEPLPPANLPPNTPPGTTTPPPELYRPIEPLPHISTPGALPTPVPPPGGNVPSVINPPINPPVTTTPKGPLINNGNIGIPGGASSATNPAGGGQSIIVPNGNGTSTVIAPDGSTQIIPTPK